MGEARRRKILGEGPRKKAAPPPARIVKVGEREHNLALAYPGCKDCLGTGVSRVILRTDDAGKQHRMNQICPCVLAAEERKFEPKADLMKTLTVVGAMALAEKRP